MANRPTLRPGYKVTVIDSDSPHDGADGVVTFEQDDKAWPIIVDIDGDQVVFDADQLEVIADEPTEEELARQQADMARSLAGDYPGDTAGEVLANAAAAGQDADNPVEPIEITEPAVPEPAPNPEEPTIPEPGTEPAPAPEVERPAGNASKAEWVAYAVAQGMPEADAEQKSRDELVEAYPA